MHNGNLADSLIGLLLLQSSFLFSDIHKPAEERNYKYTCNECGKKFRFQSNYDYHMGEHTGERPFRCTVCDKSFRTQDILNRHLATHSDERPFECMECGKTFKLKKYLDVHLLTHDDRFACSVCWRVFGSAEGLDKHICKAVVLRNTNPDDETDAQIQLLRLQEGGQEDGVLHIADGAGDLQSPVQAQAEGYQYMCAACGTALSDVDQATQHICPGAEEPGTELPTTEDSLVEPGTAIYVSSSTTHPPTVKILGVQPPEDQGVAGQAIIPKDEDLQDVEGAQIPVDAGGDVEKVGDDDVAPLVPVPLPDAETMEMYMCGICQGLFTSTEEVQEHIKIHLSGGIMNAEGLGLVAEGELPEGDVPPMEDSAESTTMDNVDGDPSVNL